MPGFGNLQRRFDRFQIAHFADQDDVRVLAQGGPQRGREAARVAVDSRWFTRQFLC